MRFRRNGYKIPVRSRIAVQGNAEFVTMKRSVRVCASLAFTGVLSGFVVSAAFGQGISSALAGGPSGSSIVAIATDPVTQSVVYAGARESGISGIYKSLNQGVTWKPVGNGLPPAPYIDIVALVLAPSLPSTVYAGVYD